MDKPYFALADLPPELEQEITRLKEKKKPVDWLLKVVDPKEPTAIFLKDGKAHYRSQCPQYEGFWLDGGIGSVQCKAANQLLPGIFWYRLCQSECSKCPYTK